MTANKLVSARSVPDMTSVYQDWFGQSMQRCVEDTNPYLLISRNSCGLDRLVQNGKLGS